LLLYNASNQRVSFCRDRQHELAGIIEVGGGSAQIAFVPATPIYEGRIPAPINGHEVGVYGHSHLSYGATVITERVKEYLFLENPHADRIVNPCMLKGANTYFYAHMA